jgi:hypothetical protein
MEYFFSCPYCGEEISFVLDLTEETQSYIEDCEVCCNPIAVKFKTDEKSVIFFEAQKTND